VVGTHRGGLAVVGSGDAGADSTRQSGGNDGDSDAADTCGHGSAPLIGGVAEQSQTQANQ
jgi:hypothetical protein